MSNFKVSFRFKPLQFVKIKAYDLRLNGRVIRCIHDGFQPMYEVEYAIEGDIQRREFLEDEII